jgi:hypothetical protein
MRYFKKKILKSLKAEATCLSIRWKKNSIKQYQLRQFQIGTVSQPNRQVAVFHGRTKGTASYDLRHADQMTITD